MRRITRLTTVGLTAALAAAIFIACKREKEQNGPSILIPNEPDVIAGDKTVPPGSTTLKFKFIFQKGSGKDDADLKDFSFTFNQGGGNVPAFSNRSAPNGTSFTWDTTFSINGTAGAVYTYTVSVRDKNDKTASRSIRITFQQPSSGQPGAYFTATITLDTVDRPFIYFTGNSITAQSLSGLSEARGVIASLVVRRVNINQYSVVTPDSLGKGNYTFPYLNWTASPKPRTTFYAITPNEYDGVTDSTSAAQLIAGLPEANKTKFSGNADGARALLSGTPDNSTTTSGPHEFLAFDQQFPANSPTSRIRGVIKRTSVSGASVSLEVKAIRQ
ncbi:MAG: hypothetical protein N3E49_02370 [Bacteroidia bacterium]|nr:hypothetical protein [Bacteroidia bacterium]